MRRKDMYEQRAKVLKALSHPSRLRMVDALSTGEQCVCELQRIVGADMSTVSKHLSVMREAGLISSEKRGLQVFYRLRVPCILRFFECVDAVLGVADADEVEKTFAPGCCRLPIAQPDTA